ncbi:MAG: methyltransferase domain-containing protein [Myxococcales bacterium]
MSRLHSSALARANVGCGATPTAGWLNFDNSATVWIARHPVLSLATRLLGRASFVESIRRGQIIWAPADKLPVEDGALEVLYSSHMLEHLDRRAVRAFLREAFRVLAPGGVLRLVVPDLSMLVRSYLEDRDADKFMTSTLMSVEADGGLRSRLKLALLGHRGHHWMYDGQSLAALVADSGFVDVRTLAPGETRMPEPGGLNLLERSDESVYVEATRP